MFYKTKVKSIFPGGIIDAHNKRLVFVGNKLARVGDLVWTDGSVVLGHTPIRGGGAFFDSPTAGVPVLCDNLQGYFDMQGKFHSAKLPVSWCFVNDDKCYYQLPEPTGSPAPLQIEGMTFQRAPTLNEYYLDAEIATDDEGKTDGIRYAVNKFDRYYGLYVNHSRTTLKVFKNGEKDETFTSRIAEFQKVWFSGGSCLNFIYLEKQNVRGYFRDYEQTGYTPHTLNANGIRVSPSHTYYRFALYGFDKTTIYKLPVERTFDWVGSYYQYHDSGEYAGSWQAVLDKIVTLSISAAATVKIPLQDGYALHFSTEDQPAEIISNISETTLQGNIFDERGKAILYGFPIYNAYRSIRSVTKLKNGCLVGTTKNELWKYSKKGGLTLVGTGLKNFRLRKMRNPLHAKVIV